MKKVIVALFLTVGLYGQTLPSANPYDPVFMAIDSLVRPNNATAYAVNDVVNDTTSTAQLLEFKYAMKPGAHGGLILSSLLELDSANTTNGNFKLLLFTDSVATAADNAAWTPAHANNARMIGSIDYSLSSNGTGAAIGEAQGVNIPFYSIEGTSYIYGVLLAKGAFTPKTLGKYRIKLFILRY